jgi:SsrA-binding protein
MSILLENKRAFFDYEILEKFEAGLLLIGWEVKSLKNRKGNLAGTWVIIRGNEAFLVGLDIPPYQPQNNPTIYEAQRTIKLLLTKKEIKHLDCKSQERGLTMVPIKMYTKDGKIKLEFGLGKGKKKFEKREKIKKREEKIRISRLMKSQKRG